MKPLKGVRSRVANQFVRALQAAGQGGVETVEGAVDRKTTRVHGRVANKVQTDFEEEWNRQKRAWLRDLEALRGSVRQWLAPVLEAQLATVADKEFPIASRTSANTLPWGSRSRSSSPARPVRFSSAPAACGSSV